MILPESWLPWSILFRTRCAELSGSVPALYMGLTPGVDIELLLTRPQGIYWVMYPLQDYTVAQWNQMYAMNSESPLVDLNLSTALILSEAVFGSEVHKLSIPDAWILSVEPKHTRVRSLEL